MTDRVQAGTPASGGWPSGSAGQIADLLGGVGYLAGEHVGGVLRLAGQLGKPVLVEGPAGTGKTSLATSLATAAGRRLIRLQCYEGLDEAKALYEWNHSKQLLRLLADRAGPEGRAGIFTEEFLLIRPLLDAIRAAEPVVLLIDEVDRLDVETEALLLEGAVGLPGLDSRARHGGRPAGTGGRLDLERLAGPVRGAAAPVPVPLRGLPAGRAGAGDRADAGARDL